MIIVSPLFSMYKIEINVSRTFFVCKTKVAQVSTPYGALVDYFMIKVFLVNVSMMPKGSTNLVLHFGGKRRLCRRQMLLMSRISLGPAMLALFGIPITLPSDEDA